MKSFPKIALALVMSTGTIFAQGPGTAPQNFNVAAAITQVKLPYLTGKQKLETDIEKLRSSYNATYLAALEKLQADISKQGALDTVLLIKAERERIASNTISTPQQLASLPEPAKVPRANYDRSFKKLTEDGVRLEGELRAKCVAELEVLQKRVTMAGYIEQALEVKKEKERLAAQEAQINQLKTNSTSENTTTASANPSSSPAPTTPPVPALTSPSDELWLRKLNRLEDHPASGDSTLRDGWITSKIDSEKKFRVLSGPIKTGAVRAELQWPASGNAGILSLRHGEKGYYLSRDRRGVALRFEDIEVGRFEVPNPKPTETYKMELRMSGQFVTAFLDGKEIIRVDDDLRQDGSSVLITAAILLEDARVRNIEVLTLTTADRGTTASSSANAGGTISVNPSGSNDGPATPSDHFETNVKKGEVIITKYVGPGGAVVIPSIINNLPVTTIEEGAFIYCHSLTSVIIPEGVKTMGRNVFRQCKKLTQIAIPSTLTKIGSSSFSDTGSLTTLIVSEQNPAYMSAPDGVLFNRSQTTLVLYPATKNVESYSIPTSVTRIEEGAFDGAQFKNIVIPEGLVYIGGAAFSRCKALERVAIPSTVTSIGSGPFSDTQSLVELIVSDKNPAYMSTAEGVLFNKRQTVLMQYPAARIADFYIIPKSVSVIGSNAFVGANIKNVTIPFGVVGIEGTAFYKCKVSGDIVIPSTVKQIGRDAFLDVHSSGFIFEGDAPECGTHVFNNFRHKAKILYYPGAKGFSSPTWMTSAGDNYPAEVNTANRVTTQKP